MEFSSWPESFSSNLQIHEAFEQELAHYQQLSDTLSDLICVSQNNETNLGTSYTGANHASEMYANACSIMCNYNVNNISHIHESTTCSSNSLDRLGDKNMAKIVKPIKKKRGCYTRKSLWTSSKITSWTDDGHAWRKYGQKEIQNAKHKRNYYRCIYKFDQGCNATKQVQKIEDDPTNFKITYHRHHTCKNVLGTPEIILDSSDVNDRSILLSFESNRHIDNKKLDHLLTPKKEKEQQPCLSSLPLSNEQRLRFVYNGSHDLTKLVPFESVSLMSSRLEHDSSIFSRHVGLGSRGFTAGQAALKAASCKVTKHEKACIENQHVFIPFAFDTFGFLAPEAVELLNRIQRVMHSNVMTPRSIDVVFKRIGFAIQKGLAAQLVARLPSTTM